MELMEELYKDDSIIVGCRPLKEYINSYSEKINPQLLG